jgi:arginase
LKPLFDNKLGVVESFVINENEFNTNYGYTQLFKLHNNSLNKNVVPIVLGGDHSIGHETVGSSVQKFGDNLLVIWIDAHADINTLEASKSKNTHGTPLAGLIGLEPVRTQEIKKLLKPENLAYYGIRDLDKFEIGILEKYKPNVIERNDFAQLSKLITKYDNVHISFDVDALDTLYVDATGTTAENGIHPDEVVKCLQIVGDKLRALDIVEFNPTLGTLNKSLESINYIIDRSLASSSTSTTYTLL